MSIQGLRVLRRLLRKSASEKNLDTELRQLVEFVPVKSGEETLFNAFCELMSLR